MTRQGALYPVAALAACLNFASAAGAAEPNLVIALNPLSSAAPDEITLEASDMAPAPLEPDAARRYRGTIDLPVSSTWVRHYIVTGTWGNRSRQLYLRITATTKCPLNLALVNIDAAATDDTLSKLNALGSDMSSLLKKYFVSRDVYRTLANVQTAARDRALRLWFDAAYNLSKIYPFIDFDPEVKKLAADAGITYYKTYLAQTAAFEWRDVADVKPLVDKGKLAEAQGLSGYYLAKFNGLDPAQQRAVTAVTGIDAGVLRGNQTFVNALAAGNQ